MNTVSYSIFGNSHSSHYFDRNADCNYEKLCCFGSMSRERCTESAQDREIPFHHWNHDRYLQVQGLLGEGRELFGDVFSLYLLFFF